MEFSILMLLGFIAQSVVDTWGVMNTFVLDAEHLQAFFTASAPLFLLTAAVHCAMQVVGWALNMFFVFCSWVDTGMQPILHRRSIFQRF